MTRREYNNWIAFGSRVRANREKLGLSREKLAEMIDRSENYLISLEKGDKSCSIHTLHQLSVSLKVSADDLLYGEKLESKNYTDREILQSMIERCNENELKVIKDVIVAMYPHLKEITK